MCSRLVFSGRLMASSRCGRGQHWHWQTNYGEQLEPEKEKNSANEKDEEEESKNINRIVEEEAHSVFFKVSDIVDIFDTDDRAGSKEPLPRSPGRRVTTWWPAATASPTLSSMMPSMEMTTRSSWPS